MVKYFILSFLLAITAGFLLAIINNPDGYYKSDVLYIEAIPENENADTLYKELQDLIMLREIQNVSSIDKIDNRVELSFSINNDMIAHKCEEVLNEIIRHKDIKGWVVTFYIDYSYFYSDYSYFYIDYT